MILQQLERRGARRVAFTLMEVLVVAVILVIMAGTASIFVFRYLEDARKDRAQMDIQTLETAVKTYALRHQGQFPENLEQVLEYIQGASQSNLFDQWGNRYQYQVTEDRRSGVRSDPNRPDDQEYIVRLVGQVIRVSIETVKIVNALPAEFAAPTPPPASRQAIPTP